MKKTDSCRVNRREKKIEERKRKLHASVQLFFKIRDPIEVESKDMIEARNHVDRT
jgi:hypothetical protein